MSDLHHIYGRAKGYKDEVLRNWIDNLSRMASNPTHRQEALRRIEFIETRLLLNREENAYA